MGSYGTVSFNKINGYTYAIKDFNDTAESLREYIIVSQLKHETISHPLGYGINTKLCITYQNADYDMHKYISSIYLSGRSLDERLILSYTCQLLIAVDYCHSQMVAHFDIKPQNILLFKDGSLKLTDFGSSRYVHFPITEKYESLTTCSYAPPENLNSESNIISMPFSVDMWSVGCVLVEMWTGTRLFDGDTKHNILQKITSFSSEVKDNKLMNIAPRMSSGAVDLTLRLLEIDPQKRLSSDEAINHPYIQNFLEDIN